MVTTYRSSDHRRAALQCECSMSFWTTFCAVFCAVILLAGYQVVRWELTPTPASRCRDAYAVAWAPVLTATSPEAARAAAALVPTARPAACLVPGLSASDLHWAFTTALGQQWNG